MKSIKNKNIAFSIITFSMLIPFILNSCTERMNIDLDNSDVKVIVYGSITTDTIAHKIKVTQSADYYSNTSPQGISGASLTITDGENSFPLTESLTEPGVYITQPNVYGIPGKTYTLSAENVAINGSTENKTYTAESTIPSLPIGYQNIYLDSINVVYYENWEGWIVNGWANEPADQKNFYMFKVYINDVAYSDSLNNLMISDDKLINGSSTNGAALYFIQEPDTLKAGYKVTLELCVINEDYFKFLYEAQTSSQPQIPIFSPPPANARTNINNGAIGYFSAYAIIKSSYIVQERDILLKNRLTKHKSGS